jgi:hypothetical protein
MKWLIAPASNPSMFHAGTRKFNLPAAVASINFASTATNLYVAFSGLPGKRH